MINAKDEGKMEINTVSNFVGFFKRIQKQTKQLEIEKNKQKENIKTIMEKPFVKFIRNNYLKNFLRSMMI